MSAVSEKNYDVIIKILLSGSHQVRNNLMLRYVENRHSESNIRSLGVDFMMKDEVLDGTRVRMQIWSLSLFYITSLLQDHALFLVCVSQMLYVTVLVLTIQRLSSEERACALLLWTSLTEKRSICAHDTWTRSTDIAPLI